MTVCSFFLQGRCRYGEKCWNDHPRGGRAGPGPGAGGGGGSYGDFNRGAPQATRGGGGFGNRVWINPSQRSGADYVQPSSFSRGGNDWGKGGGGGGRDTKSSNFSFSNQNRFSSLNSQGFARDGQGTGDESEKHLETIRKDMEIWESSGQWPFSCYSPLKASISGFVELSQEELRLEYYTGRASGDLQTYANTVQHLANQWRNRVQELKAMNSSLRAAMIAEMNDPNSQTSSAGFPTSSSGFGSSASNFDSASSGFGSGGFGAAAQSSASFSFAPPSSGFGSAASQPAAAPAPSSSGFASSAPSSTPSAASFSFGPPAASTATSSSFGSAAGFSFSSSVPAGGFGGAGTGAVFGQPATAGGSAFGFSGGFGAGASVAPSTGTAGGPVGPDSLYSAHSELTEDELKEFSAKRFTLGQIPLKPPPTDLLIV